MSYFILHFEGKLVGVTPFEWVSLPGVSVEEVQGDIPDLNFVLWDEESLSLVSTKTYITKLEFLSKFTTQERINIRNSGDPIVNDVIDMLREAEGISLIDSRIVQAIGYFAAIGLIDAERVQEILT